MTDRVDELLKIEGWQLQNLIELGFGLDDAERILRNQIDYHDIAKLMENGCERQTAIRILMPLERK